MTTSIQYCIEIFRCSIKLLVTIVRIIISHEVEQALTVLSINKCT